MSINAILLSLVGLLPITLAISLWLDHRTICRKSEEAERCFEEQRGNIIHTTGFDPVTWTIRTCEEFPELCIDTEGSDEEDGSEYA